MICVIVFFVVVVGMMYIVLWYLFVFMVLGGIVVVVYDFRWLYGLIVWLWGLFCRNKGFVQVDEEEFVVEIELRSRDSIFVGLYVSVQ